MMHALTLRVQIEKQREYFRKLKEFQRACEVNEQLTEQLEATSG